VWQRTELQIGWFRRGQKVWIPAPGLPPEAGSMGLETESAIHPAAATAVLLKSLANDLV